MLEKGLNEKDLEFQLMVKEKEIYLEKREARPRNLCVPSFKARAVGGLLNQYFLRQLKRLPGYMGGLNSGELQDSLNKSPHQLYVAYDGSSHDSHMSQELLKVMLKHPFRFAIRNLPEDLHPNLRAAFERLL